MQPPQRLRASRTGGPSTSHPGRRCSATAFFWHESCTCTSPPTSSPGSWWPGAYAFARLRGRWGRYERTAWRSRSTIGRARRAAAGRRRRLGRARGGGGPAGEARRHGRARPTTTRGRAGARARLVRRTTRSSTGIAIPKLLSFLAFHDPNATVQGLDAVPADRPSAGERRPRSRSRRWSGSARCSRCSASVFLVRPRPRGDGCPSRAGSTGRSSLAGPLSVVALDRRLGHDRGRPPAVGRLRGDAHRGRP